jgi:hypothetical protein
VLKIVKTSKKKKSAGKQGPKPNPKGKNGLDPGDMGQGHGFG